MCPSQVRCSFGLRSSSARAAPSRTAPAARNTLRLNISPGSLPAGRAEHPDDAGELRAALDGLGWRSVGLPDPGAMARDPRPDRGQLVGAVARAWSRERPGAVERATVEH